MRPIIPVQPVLNTPRSIILPDGQQFFHDKLVNISQAANVLTLNLANVATPITYTSTTSLAASYLAASIAEAVASGVGGSVRLAEVTFNTSVSIASYAPDPIVSVTVQALTLTGAGFLLMTGTIQVAVVYPGGGGGPVYNYCTDVVVVDDTTITCNTPELAVGTWALIIHNEIETFVQHDVTVL